MKEICQQCLDTVERVNTVQICNYCYWKNQSDEKEYMSLFEVNEINRVKDITGRY